MSDCGPPKQAHRYQKQADTLIPTFEKVNNRIPLLCSILQDVTGTNHISG